MAKKKELSPALAEAYALFDKHPQLTATKVAELLALKRPTAWQRLRALHELNKVKRTNGRGPGKPAVYEKRGRR